MMMNISTAFQKGIVEVLMERLYGVLDPRRRIKGQYAPVARMMEGLIVGAPPTIFNVEDVGESSRIVWN